jgi:hypothetical protein
MKALRTLGQLAGGMGSVYRIVFTGMLLYELVKFGLKRNLRAENHRNYPADRGH